MSIRFSEEGKATPVKLRTLCRGQCYVYRNGTEDGDVFMFIDTGDSSVPTSRVRLRSGSVISGTNLDAMVIPIDIDARIIQGKQA